MQAAPTAAAPQRVCPHCSTVAHTSAGRCPLCRRSYRRSTLLGVAALLAVTAAVVLGGVALLLTSFGATLDGELDRQVTTVQSDLERQVDELQTSIREDLDRRLPAAPQVVP